MKYLSTHSSYIYAKISKELDVDMPLSNGPGRFIFQREDDSEVRVGDKVYFKGYHNEIKDGRIIIKIGNVMTINMPMYGRRSIILTLIILFLLQKRLRDNISIAI